MPVISMFYEIIICLYFYDKDKGCFSTVYATKYGIEWKNGQDVNSDTIIYDINNQ